MYDQLGGGFHRYSTDERWLVPHFEKMLYDNALLSRRLSRSVPGHRHKRYLPRDRRGNAGLRRARNDRPEPAHSSARRTPTAKGSRASSSSGRSKKSKRSLRARNKSPHASKGTLRRHLFCSVYDVTDSGNWEEHNILHLTRDLDDRSEDAIAAARRNEDAAASAAREKLLDVRGKRIWPGRDEKILTAWNALMIAPFAKAAQVLEKPEYADAAVRAADFLLTTMRRPDGRLYRTTLRRRGAEAERLSRRLRLPRSMPSSRFTKPPSSHAGSSRRCRSPKS